jgi:type IV secretory pathway ATPase VirB11/archaellum biosynthesis ATPase
MQEEPVSEVGIQTRPFLDDLATVVPEPATETAASTAGAAHLFAAATKGSLRLVEDTPASSDVAVETTMIPVLEAAAADSAARPEPVAQTGPLSQAAPISPPPPRPSSPVVGDRVEVDGVDWRLVDRLTKQLTLDADRQRTREDFDVAIASARPETGFEERVFGEITRLVARHADYLAINRGPDFEWSGDKRARHVQAVFDSVFRYGRLQQYLREPDIEDISVVGFDNVLVTTADGRKHRRAPIAFDNDDLEAQIADLASWRGRAFARPGGHIDLDIGGARFSATGRPITSVPNITMRKHNHVDVTLGDMVGLGTITAPMAALLNAAARANLCALVSGWASAGKTTFLRAWMSALPWEEKIVTIETEHELYLGKQRHRHAQVQDFQYLPSMLAGSDLAVTYRLEDAFREGLRSSAQRILFGEIRGAEGPVAIKAMQAGKGSISTTHARNADDAIHRFADILMSEQSLSDDTVPLRQILRSIDLIIHLDMLHHSDGTRRRLVTEIAEVIPQPNGQLPMASLLYAWDWDKGVYTRPEKPSRQLQQALGRVGLDPEQFWAGAS